MAQVTVQVKVQVTARVKVPVTYWVANRADDNNTTIVPIATAAALYHSLWPMGHSAHTS